MNRSSCTADRWPCDSGHIPIRCGCNECFALEVLTKIVCVAYFLPVSRANISSFHCYVKKAFPPMELGGFPYSCFGGLHRDATVSACIMKFTKCDNMCWFSSWERMKRLRCWSCRLAIKNSLPRAMQFRGHEDLPSWAPRSCQSLARLPSGRQEQMWEEAAIIHGKYTHPFKKPFCVNHL